MKSSRDSDGKNCRKRPSIHGQGQGSEAAVKNCPKNPERVKGLEEQEHAEKMKADPDAVGH